ncbi:hypothetical protein VDGL01_09890 [Verticillium dahliae]
MSSRADGCDARRRGHHSDGACPAHEASQALAQPQNGGSTAGPKRPQSHASIRQTGDSDSSVSIAPLYTATVAQRSTSTRMLVGRVLSDVSSRERAPRPALMESLTAVGTEGCRSLILDPRPSPHVR